jgi:septum formation protein
VVLGDDVLEKPLDQAEAVAMLLRLSGNTHCVMTAVSVVYQGVCETRLNTTQVRFRSISEEEAIAYYQTGEPCDKAGSYGIQGLGAIFVESIEGSYSGVVGLPLFETATLLVRFS